MIKEIKRKIIGRICTLIVVGIFMAMALSPSVRAPAGVEWHTTGNDPDAGDFLGTTTSEDLVIKTDSTTRMVVEADGDLNVDSGTLFVDESADRVGIGDTTPDFKLEVTGYSGSGYFGVTSSSSLDFILSGIQVFFF